MREDLKKDAETLSKGICLIKNLEAHEEAVLYLCLAYFCVYEELIDRDQNVGLAKNLASLHYGSFLNSGIHVSVILEGFSDKAFFYYPRGFSSVEKLLFEIFLGPSKEISVSKSTFYSNDFSPDNHARKELKINLGSHYDKYVDFMPLSIFEDLEKNIAISFDSKSYLYKKSVLFNPPRSILDEQVILKLKKFGMVLGEPHGGNYCYYKMPTAREFFETEVCDFYSSPNNNLWPNIRASKNKVKYYLAVRQYFYLFPAKSNNVMFVLPLLSYNGEVPDNKKINIILNEVIGNNYESLTIRFHPYESNETIKYVMKHVEKIGVPVSVNDNTDALLLNVKKFSKFLFFDINTTASIELCYSGKCYVYNGFSRSLEYYSSFFLNSLVARGGGNSKETESHYKNWFKVNKKFSNSFYDASFLYVFKFVFFIRSRSSNF